MNGPYLTRRAYMYGHTFFDDPVPYYNTTRHHRIPGHHPYPPYRGLKHSCHQDDGSDYIGGVPVSEAGIERHHVRNILNIETMIVRTLRVYIYGLHEEDDYVVDMEIGNRYAITYVTDTGVKFADGYLRVISTSVPDDCTKYIGDYSSTVAQAYIGLDCSTKGISDKRKIYIANIRDIVPLANDEDYTPPETDEDAARYNLLERLQNILDNLESCKCAQMDSEIEEKFDAINIKLNTLKSNVNTALTKDCDCIMVSEV